MKRILMTMAMVAAMCAVQGQQTVTWEGGATGEWSEGGNWSTGFPPDVGEDVVIPGGVNVTLDVPTPLLGTVSVASGATLTFVDWTNCLSAAEVVVNGTLTHPVTDLAPFVYDYGTSAWDAPNPTYADRTNRIWIACGDFTLNGTINVNGKGFWGALGAGQQGQGPGGGIEDQGGSHGGAAWGTSGSPLGAGVPFRLLGRVYGSITEPLYPGSGGGSRIPRTVSNSAANAEVGGCGGGAVAIEASGIVTLNGSILACGQDAFRNAPGGAGGSVYITADTLVANNAAVIDVRGGNGWGSSRGNNGFPGGGGRVALHYVNSTGLGFMKLYAGGGAAVPFGGVGASFSYLKPSDPGTLYMSDASAFVGQGQDVTFLGGEIHIPDFNELTLTLSRLMLAKRSSRLTWC